jgi:hypothetical protein
MKFHIGGIFKTLSRTIKFHKNLIGITGTSHEDLCTFMIIRGSVILKMGNVLENFSEKYQNIHFIFHKSFFFYSKSCLL